MDAFERICEKVQAQEHDGFDYRLWDPYSNTLHLEYAEVLEIEEERTLELISWVQFHQYLSPAELKKYRCPGLNAYPNSKYRTRIREHFREDIMPDGEHIRPDADIPDAPPLFHEWTPVYGIEEIFCNCVMAKVQDERHKAHDEKQAEIIESLKRKIEAYTDALLEKATQPNTDQPMSPETAVEERKAEKAKRGRQRIGKKERAFQHRLVDAYKNAKDAGVLKKEFLADTFDEKTISAAELKKAMNNVANWNKGFE